MEEADYSGIDPLRVPEARRRVAALNAFLKLPDPSAADVRRFASSIGLSRNPFLRLARVWREHRDARLLVVGKRGASTRKYNVDPRAKDIAYEVIAQIGAAATLAGTAPEIERRCAAEKLAPPARSTINNYIKDARASTAEPASGPPRIVIGRMWFHLPIKGSRADAMPNLLAAVMLPERIIVAHSISTDPLSPPSISDLIDRLAITSTPGTTPRPLLLDAEDRRVGADALARAGLGCTRSHYRSVQRELSKAFAGRLGPLSAIYQRRMARPATKRVITRQDEPLDQYEVVKIIDNAVRSHNAATLMAVPTFELAPIPT